MMIRLSVAASISLTGASLDVGQDEVLIIMFIAEDNDESRLFESFHFFFCLLVSPRWLLVAC